MSRTGFVEGFRLLQAAKPCSSRQNWEGLRRSFCPIRPSHICEGHTSIAAKPMAPKKQLIPMLICTSQIQVCTVEAWRPSASASWIIPAGYDLPCNWPRRSRVVKHPGLVECLVLLSIAPGLSNYVPKSVPKTHCLMTKVYKKQWQSYKGINQSVFPSWLPCHCEIMINKKQFDLCSSEIPWFMLPLLSKVPHPAPFQPPNGAKQQDWPSPGTHALIKSRHWHIGMWHKSYLHKMLIKIILGRKRNGAPTEFGEPFGFQNNDSNP